MQAGILGNGVGAVCSTGFGDGLYPVYVEYADEGAWGRRVKRLVIEFIGDETEEADDTETCEECGDEMYGFHNGRVCPECETGQALEDDEDE